MRARVIAGLVGVILCAPAAAGAHSGFPGSNGRIAFSANWSGAYEIWTINPDGTNPTRLTNLSASGGATYGPAYSPDGKKMVFYRHYTGPAPDFHQIWELWTMNADGGGQTKIATYDNTGPAVNPVFGPDGSIVFTAPYSSTGLGADEVWSIPPGGGSPVRITGDQYTTMTATYGDDDPAVSPDGKTIAFDSVRPGQTASEIWTISLSDGTEHQLTSSHCNAQPAWSPDGAKIVYSHSDCSGGFTLYEMNADGSGQTPLPAQGTEPAWSPDGTTIAYRPLTMGGPAGLDKIGASGSGNTPITSMTDVQGVAWQTIPAAPAITSVTPSTGPAAGGTTVTISGSGFYGASGVAFGGVAATSYKVVSPSQITAVSPPGTGTVDVRVSTPAGTSASSAADHFTYLGASGKPVIVSAHESHDRWREGDKLATFTASGKPPVGTTFSFTLNEQAKVTFGFALRTRGRRVHHRCVAQTKHNRGRPACTRYAPAGTLTFEAHPGVNHVRFDGRLSRKRRLALGHYKLTIVASSASGQRSRAVSLSFTIVAG